MKMNIKRNDFILLGAILLLSVFLFLIYRFFPAAQGSSIIIKIDGNIQNTLPLKQDTTYVIQTGKYSNTLQIKDGSASIIKANCPDKLCVHQHKISKKGETLICLPHKLVISVDSPENQENTNNSEEGFDGIAK